MKQGLNEREKRIFREMPELQAVLTLAVPTVLSQIISVIYNLADTYYIGQTKNPDMVAAASICMTLMLLMTGMANLFGIGGSSLIARCLGEQKFEKARHVSAFSVWAGFLFAAFYSVILLLFHPFILRLLGAGDGTFPYCRSYMFWTCVIGGIPTVMNPLLAHLVRSEGASKEASIGVSLGGVINMILDPVFMFGLLPDGYEVMGAAMATMVSNCIAAIYFIVYILRHRASSVLTLSPREFSVQESIPADVVSIGLPSFLMTALSSASNAVVNNLISEASSAAVAGMGIAKKINMLSFRVSTGVTQGALSLIAYNHSAGNYTRMKRSIAGAAKITVGFAAFCMCVSMLFGGGLVKLFIDDAATVEFGQNFIHIISLAMPLAAATMTMMMFFQASAKKAQATALSMMRKGILDIPLMFLFNSVWPVYGVACATPVAEIIGCAVALVLVWRYMRTLKGE